MAIILNTLFETVFFLLVLLFFASFFVFCDANEWKHIHTSKTLVQRLRRLHTGLLYKYKASWRFPTFFQEQSWEKSKFSSNSLCTRQRQPERERGKEKNYMERNVSPTDINSLEASQHTPSISQPPCQSLEKKVDTVVVVHPLLLCMYMRSAPCFLYPTRHAAKILWRRGNCEEKLYALCTFFSPCRNVHVQACNVLYFFVVAWLLQFFSGDHRRNRLVAVFSYFFILLFLVKNDWIPTKT